MIAMLSSARPALCLLLFLAPGTLLQRAPTAQDPELSDGGRESYMGRTIARTMHWSGAEWLLREEREDEERASLLLEELQLEPGDRVADLGCGNGFHSLPIAERVGAEGKVFAVDVQPEMLRLLDARVAERELENVTSVLGSLRDPGLAPKSCDLVLMVDVYHELSHPVSVLARSRAALAPGGELVLVEFRLEDPDVPIKLLHKMSKAQVLGEMAANGFRFAREYDGLPWQHFLAFEVDPAFPREEGQELAEGEAIAGGIARAWRRGDLSGLAAFCQEEVFVPANEGPLVLMERVEREEWLRSLHRRSWTGPPEDWSLETQVSIYRDSPALKMTLVGCERALSLEMARDDVGRWRVVAQRGPPESRPDGERR